MLEANALTELFCRIFFIFLQTVIILKNMKVKQTNLGTTCHSAKFLPFF